MEKRGFSSANGSGLGVPSLYSADDVLRPPVHAGIDPSRFPPRSAPTGVSVDFSNSASCAVTAARSGVPKLPTATETANARQARCRIRNPCWNFGEAHKPCNVSIIAHVTGGCAIRGTMVGSTQDRLRKDVRARRFGRRALWAAALACVLVPDTRLRAADLFDSDGWDLRWDNTIRYTTAIRLFGQDAALIANPN